MSRATPVRSSWGWLGVVNFLSIGFAMPVTAQTGTPQSNTPNLATTSAQPIAAVDTVIRPGWQDFTRYTTPGVCLSAATGLDWIATRVETEPNSYPVAIRDTLPSAVVAMARACGAKFTVAAVDEAQLMKFMELALMAGNDAQARAIAERRLSLISDPVQRAYELRVIGEAYLNAHPMRLAAAEAVAARLDTIGAVAAVSRNVIHRSLWKIAVETFDVAKAEREAVALWRLEPVVRGSEDRDIYTYGQAGTEAVELLGMYLVTMPPAEAVARVVQLLGDANPPLATQWQTEVKNSPLFTQLFARIGQPVPPLSAQYWFGPKGQHSWPVPGAVSLLLSDGLVRKKGHRGEAAMVRRMKQKYGEKLNIVLLLKTKGYLNNSPPLSPAQEAERLRRYVQDTLKLAVTVAVEETAFRTLPDGRRLDQGAPLDRDTLYGTGFALVDPKGKLILPVSYLNEVVLDAIITRALDPKNGRGK